MSNSPGRLRRRACIPVLLAALIALASAHPLHADEVTDWNGYLLEAARVGGTSPLAVSRVAAIVQASVFDAVNGIERRYTPLHVVVDAPRGASTRAAAIQAAYASLVKLYPSQQTTLDAHRAASLVGVASSAGVEHSESIARGIAWGQFVADEIAQWRSSDGFSAVLPPFTGSTDPGTWRPTPPSNAPGAGVQFATMTPWVMQSPSQFRPAGPPVLGSRAYLADLDETGSLGRDSSTIRSSEQTVYAWFWASGTATYFWNGVTARLAAARHATLSENARVFALVNVAMADAAIACWDAKYHYVAWRPITAMRVTDSTWTPLIPTPNHPEYPSGHSSVSGAAAAVLAGIFGEATPFVVDSDGARQADAGAGAAPMAGLTRSFSSFTSALEEVKEARIVGGIHFRTACDDGQAIGRAAAAYVIANAFQPLDGNKTGQLAR